MRFSLRPQMRKFGTIFGGICLTALVATGLFFAQSKLFEIYNIEVVGSGITITFDENKVAKNLLFFPAHTVRSMLLAEHALLEDVRFVKKFPHTLIIEPIVRRPIAVLTTRTQTVSLDRTGVVLPWESKGSLPNLMFDIATVHEGQKLHDERVLQALGFVDNFDDAVSVIRWITMRDGSSLVAKIDEIDILFTQDAPISSVVATLQTLLSGFRIKGSLPKIIDLRFDKPTVSF